MKLKNNIRAKDIIIYGMILLWLCLICGASIQNHYKIAFVLTIITEAVVLRYKLNANLILKSFFVAIISFVCIEIGNLNHFDTITWDKSLLNIYILVIGYLGIYAILRKMHIADVVFSVSTGIISIIAYYVYQFRNVPLSISNIYQIRTALLVISQYQFKMSYEVIFILYSVLLVCALGIYEKKTDASGGGRKRAICYALTGIISLFIILNTPINKLMNVNTLSWNLQEAYHKNGLLVDCIWSSKLEEAEVPEGFSNEKYVEICKSIIAQKESVLNTDYPDIILIVNESYFDLHRICEYSTEEAEQPFINSLKNVVRGYAVNPNGTTGNSEYEILTSNSLYLKRNAVPFLTGDLSEENSMVKNLSQLGYETTAIHSEPGYSYNRINTYPSLGFDDVIFLKDERSISEDEIIRQAVSDETLFREILNHYHSRDVQKPQFIYCLTMQNHGGYNLGGISPVKTNENFGEKQNEMGEYLGLLQYTDTAFQKLIEYFEGIDKRTIICMVGDHAPVIAPSIYNIDASGYEEWIRISGTPLIIWANYPLENTGEIGDTSMIYLQNLLFEEANLPLTLYQQYIKDMRTQIPVIGLGYYMGNDGKYYDFDSESRYNKILTNYLYLEYGNIENMKCDIDIYEY